MAEGPPARRFLRLKKQSCAISPDNPRKTEVKHLNSNDL
jgi:hypothetical protein